MPNMLKVRSKNKTNIKLKKQRTIKKWNSQSKR